MSTSYANTKEARKQNEEAFIEKSKEKFGDHFDYSKVKYVNNSTKVTITCTVHSKDFEQTPAEHINGKRCKVCYEKSLLTNKKFIDQSKDLHNDKYAYDLDKNDNKLKQAEKIDIYCPFHGKFEQSVFNHLKGHGCPSCGGKKLYDLKKYTEELQALYENEAYIPPLTKRPKPTKLEKIPVYCYVHGWVYTDINILWQKKSHCSKCSGKYRYDTMDFIEEARKVHNNFYSYKKTNYVRSSDKVIITCPIHGDFEQVASSHLGGSGCGVCAKTRNKYSYSGKGYIYLVEFNNRNKSENFIKIGVTGDLDKRFAHFKTDTDYTTNLLSFLKFEDIADCYIKEKEIHESLKKHSYQPLQYFGGWKECFSPSIKENVIEMFESIR